MTTQSSFKFHLLICLLPIVLLLCCQQVEIEEEVIITGCMDLAGLNYEPEATEPGECVYSHAIFYSLNWFGKFDSVGTPISFSHIDVFVDDEFLGSTREIFGNGPPRAYCNLSTTLFYELTDTLRHHWRSVIYLNDGDTMYIELPWDTLGSFRMYPSHPYECQYINVGP